MGCMTACGKHRTKDIHVSLVLANPLFDDIPAAWHPDVLHSYRKGLDLSNGYHQETTPVETSKWPFSGAEKTPFSGVYDR